MCYAKPGPRCSAHASAKLTRLKTLRTTQGHTPELEERIIEAQEDYDSTPAGFLELERRIESEKRSPYANKKALQKFQTRLTQGKQRRADALQAIKSLDYGDKKHDLVEPITVPQDIEDNDVSVLLEHDKNSAEAFKCKELLINASEQWVNNISPEEAEALSWGTSNGSAVLRAHLNGEEHEIWGHDVYPEEHLNNVVESLDRAMDKAPRLEKPIYIYRGLNTETFSGIDPSLEEIETKFPVGSTYHPPFSESATMHPKIAYGFSAPSVVMKVQSKTLASPANVSAWGTSEMEALINHRKEYKITGITQEQWGTSQRGTERHLTVISLEEL